MCPTYAEEHARSLADPEGFWRKAAAQVRWSRPFERVLDHDNPPFTRWFSGGELNTCDNALDRHVEAGKGERLALIYDSPVTGQKLRLSYRELLQRVAKFAGGLRALGVEKGDRVLIYMPMVPEAVIGMLACARLGAVHSVVFGGFAAKELATRIDDAEPRVILSASCGIEGKRIVHYQPLLEHALELASATPEHCVILERPQASATLGPRDLPWQSVAAGEPVAPVPVAATDPLYILYTSGTTGVPKGVLRDNGGHAVALTYSLSKIYGMRPGDVFWAASDIGWVVGHSYIVYAPLLLGCTTVLYEGKPVGTPDAGAFWRVASEHGVHALFTAPTAFRAIRKEDPRGEYIAKSDLSQLRTLFLAGERADPATVEWAQARLGIPVVDHYWQTETGWPIAANCMGIEPLPVKPGSATRAVPGYDVRVVDEAGHEVPAGESGEIVVKLPLPPGCFPTLWRNDARFQETYFTRFPGCYETDDAGYMDEDGYLFVMARTDDIINVAGHRLSTGGIEQILASHPDVAECAVIGAADAMKGQLPVGLVVLNADAHITEAELQPVLVQRVRETLGPVAAFKRVAVVPRLPKTRSGKVLRKTMRKIADAEPYVVPATIDDPATLDDIATALARLGYPPSAASS